MYFPVRQFTLLFPDATLIVRTSQDPSSLDVPLTGAVAAVDPNIAPFDVRTLDSALTESTSRERSILMLLTGFAVIALALAVVGIYGVVAYAVGRRRREFVVRMALGAPASQVFSEVIRDSVVRSVIAVGAGIGIALVTANRLQPLVFETSTRDAMTYSAVGGILIAVAFLGAALPAFRASRLNPAVALRDEE
jgi:ABC-type antimicrobial peptide transport system permease subunit